MHLTTEHIDKETFKQIFREHWEDFQAANPRYATDYYNQVVHKMLDCGDPDKMGFVQFRCLACGETRRIACEIDSKNYFTGGTVFRNNSSS
jgi:hypothetical protein